MRESVNIGWVLISRLKRDGKILLISKQAPPANLIILNFDKTRIFAEAQRSE